jgi:putative ABC transport system ATP-binding protein
MTDPIISAASISKIYKSGASRTHAVDDISININKGDKIAITGLSGCGKTTLINMLGLIVKPTAGSISIEGSTIESLNDYSRARLRNKFFGYVVQDFALIEDQSSFSNIEIPLLYSVKKYSRSERRRMIVNIAESLGIQDKLYAKTKHLSGGQRQRVAIARAIVNDPSVILADEPTGSLDIKSGEEVMTILDGLVDQGKTLLLVTHNMELAARCHRRISMLDGKIISDHSH